jgi:hypothetical protein
MPAFSLNPSLVSAVDGGQRKAWRCTPLVGCGRS